jgi:uncharacterized RDD family membrane protein YckC
MQPEISILKKRVYAFTADLGIVVVANYFLMASFTHFVETVFFYFPTKVQLFLINKMAVMSSISLMSLTFAYFSLFYFVTNGRTVGKSFFGLQVRNTNGEELSLQQSMMRAIAYFTCAITGSFLFALSYIRKDEKSLADVFSGTTVELDFFEEKMTGTEFQLTLLEAQQDFNEEDNFDSQGKAA